MTRKDLDTWNLKDIIRTLNSRIDTIEEIYLFGSRGFNTSSFRSDIDLLVFTKSPLKIAEIAHWLFEELNPVDVFETNDKQIARSILNGSSIVADKIDIVETLQAKLLWSKKDDFSAEFSQWNQLTLKDANFAMTLMPIPKDFSGIVRKFTAMLEENGYPNTHLGSEWEEIVENIAGIIKQSVSVPRLFNARAKFISKGNFKLNDEYDFQNLIQIVLKPWIPSVESENLVVRYNGQDKNADFSILRNSVVIEAKHIKSDNDRAGILKTIEGLKDFYKTNANVKALLFIILVDESVKLDDYKIQADYSYKATSPIVLTKIIRNKLV